jgi:uncharacterized protein YwgA
MQMDTRGVVLAVVEGMGGKIRSRTILQKLCYFTSEKLNLGIPFEAHFYGPYSEEVALSTSRLSSLGILMESKEPVQLASTDPVYESVRYSYSISDSGKAYLEMEQNKIESKAIEDEIARIRDIATENGIDLSRPTSISTAAKINFVLKEQGRQLTYDEIRELAEDLGWKVLPEEIDKMVGFLEAMGMARRAS